MIFLMSFKSYIAMVAATSSVVCGYIDKENISSCTLEVKECVMDGETIEFCGENYINEKELE